MYFSNSTFDANNFNDSKDLDEMSVKRFYERVPYPDLGANLKDPGWLYLLEKVRELPKNVRYLDVGCGTGHMIVGLGKMKPNWECVGIDLSEPSLVIAHKLKEKHHVQNIQLVQGSYLDDLSHLGQFDIIGCHGTIHHCADPAAALNNLSSLLMPDGLMYVHLYGWRCDQKKFDIKEMLNIMESDLSHFEERFYFYDALMKEKKRRWLKTFSQMRIIDIYAVIRDTFRNMLRRSRKVSWSPPFTENYTSPTAPWIDHFCHPCERAYELPDVLKLFAQTNLKIIEMGKQCKERPNLIPKEWQKKYRQLSIEEKWRLSELLSDGGGSFAIVARKKR